MAPETSPNSPRGVRVFVSYAHVDETLRERLRTHLSALEREGLISAWDDREIAGGEDWATAIDDRLNAADLVLLLVTADFIRSDYCFGIEMKRALERHADPRDQAIVIPVIAKRCDWEKSPFAKLQALPRDARPLAEWKTEDDYYTAVAKGLRKRIGGLRAPGDSWLTEIGRRMRDPSWWHKSSVWASAAAVAVIAIGLTAWWWREATRTDGDVARAMLVLRSGRYADAKDLLEPACVRLVRRGACLALDKARLGTLLEQPEALPLERFSDQLEALKAQAPDDPDVLLIAAELTLREDRPEQHTRALADIDRAIALTRGDYPEAYFYMANLRLMNRQFAESLVLLDRAVNGNDVAPPHYLNARAYARALTGNVDGAVRDYEASAELGLILSRIELAPLLWSRSQFDHAADQLLEAERASRSSAFDGRNALPWLFAIDGRDPLQLKSPDEKRCIAQWMARAGLALAGRVDTRAPEAPAPCGPNTTGIRAAVAAMLQQSVDNGMNEVGFQRAAEFAKQHNLRPVPSREARDG